MQTSCDVREVVYLREFVCLVGDLSEKKTKIFVYFPISIVLFPYFLLLKTKMSSEDDDIPEIDLDLIVKPYQFEPLVRNENAANATAQLGDSDIDIESNSSGSEETNDQNSVKDVRVVSKATFDVNTDRIGNTKC